MRRSVAVGVVAVGLVPGFLAAQQADWPQFRGPTGMGVSTAQGLPVKWGPNENLAWKVAPPGPGTSSPIVVGDKIILTCYTGFNVPGQRGRMEDLRLHVVCYRSSDGSQLWSQELKPKLPEQDRIREEHGYASSTPVSDGQRIYAFFGKSGVFAFDLAGKPLWHADVGGGLNGWGSAASPVIFGELVIVNASVESESLVALNRKTGAEVWRARGIQEAWNTPVLVPAGKGKTELVVAIPRQLLAFDPATGKRLWSCDTDIGWYMVPSVVAHQGTIWAIGGRSGVAALAVRAGGMGDVTQSHRLWTGRHGSNVSSPVVYDGHLFWVNDNLGVAHCAKAETGELVYAERLDRGGQFYASALLADGKLYYVSRSGKTFVLPAKPQFQLLAVNDLQDGSTFNASPAVAGRRLLLRSNRFLYCIGGH
ncbi:MAG: PQQ-binding-like beta-propeller repeat protein [Gemmataceae bacterium]|nr:PQQ-binding-like beta-propeller repeat protein [Gemmataceae bacterium]MDW8267064.1 PQQ-binding-like beta-propeller repeat protein [Gemmataceae bacterium]